MFLTIKNLRKMYDEKNGVKQLTLDVKQGEFVTLLGPSGCGKTTVLRMLGGFLTPEKGEVFLDGENITWKDPEERAVSTIFQNYALFTHMNVIENICFGLINYQNLSKKEAAEKAKEYIDLVGLRGYEKTNVQNLSGGQQQRVAIARSVAIEPKLLLLDEPFSNLDAALREKVREDLKVLQKKLQMTMIFVTHDQAEALSLSDRIVVMDRGEVMQVGSPNEIYQEPANPFVQDFFGGVEPHFMVRSEELEIVSGEEGVILEKHFLGALTEYVVEWQGEKVRIMTLGNDIDVNVNDRVNVRKKGVL